MSQRRPGGDRRQAAPRGWAGRARPPVVDAIRATGVAEVTHHRWRQQYGGLKSDQVKRMKEPETENQRLHKAIADLTLDTLILQEAARGTF